MSLLRTSLALALVALLCLCSLGGVSGTSNTDHENDVRTPSASPRTLVVLDDADTLLSHSTFFDQLTARGHDLHFGIAGIDVPALSKFGAFHFDNLVLFCGGSDDFGESLALDEIQSFVDSGRSVLIAGGVVVGEPMRELLSEYSIDVDAENTLVIDHSTGSIAIGDSPPNHDAIVGRLNRAAAKIYGAASGPILFRGLGHVAQPSALLSGVLTGSASAYSGQPNSSTVLSVFPAASGRDVLLVSAIQTPLNARVSYCGSIDLFSNRFLSSTIASSGAGSTLAAKATPTGNAAFVRQLSSWTFHETGLIRARKLTHVKRGAEHDVNPHGYRVQDQVSFSIIIEEYDGVRDVWVPFVSSDVQLELTMLDPYMRIDLAASADGVYTTQFQMPDIYGVFKFVINYYRVGYSNLEVASQVNVHPFRHDEFERFIVVAYPYYASAFTIMAAFFAFGIVFLYHKE